MRSHGTAAHLVARAELPGPPLEVPPLRASVPHPHSALVRSAVRAAWLLMARVVFLGGAMDGLEMDIPLEVMEFRFAKYDDKPAAELEREMREGYANRALKTTFVAYRKTPKVTNGRRVYSLVTRD